MMQGRKAALLALSPTPSAPCRTKHHGPGQGQPGSRHPLPGFCLGPKGFVPRHFRRPDQRPWPLPGIGITSGKLLAYKLAQRPLRRNVTIEEVGNAAAFMLSDLASGITGEIMYVDGGMNTVVAL